MKVLYVTFAPDTFTAGTYPNYPGSPFLPDKAPFTITGQHFFVSGDAYQPAVPANPFAANASDPFDSGLYIENPIEAGYSTANIVAVSFTKPADFDSKPMVPDGNGSTNFKYDVAVVSNNFQLPPTPSLFTTGNDKVNFGALFLSQVEAINSFSPRYDDLGGASFSLGLSTSAAAVDLKFRAATRSDC